MITFTSLPPFLTVDTNLPALVLQAVVEFGPKTHEGQIVEAVYPAWREIALLLQNDPSQVHQIPWRKWEELMAGYYRNAGFDVTLTPRSGDGGKDIIAVLPGQFTVRFVEQVKAYGPGHLVTADEVRALLHVLANDRQASKGVVTTTSSFAPKIDDDPTIKPYLPTRLELINGTELVRRLGEAAQQR